MRGEERYEILAYQTGHLVYDYNIKTGAIDWAGAAEEVIGFSQAEADQTMDIKRWEEMIHPEDRAKTMEMLSEAEKTAGRFQTKYRFLHKNGNYVWIEDAGVFLKDKDGTCCRMVGMMKKIEG
jgi:PAS domain S-box-containing protein